jgi:hypothetical protein
VTVPADAWLSSVVERNLEPAILEHRERAVVVVVNGEQSILHPRIDRPAAGVDRAPHERRTNPQILMVAVILESQAAVDHGHPPCGGVDHIEPPAAARAVDASRTGHAEAAEHVAVLGVDNTDCVRFEVNDGQSDRRSRAAGHHRGGDKQRHKQTTHPVIHP